MAGSKQMTGETAIVCGGSKGIGLATAREMVRRGASVGLVARGSDALQDAVDELRPLMNQENQFVEAISADTTQQDDIGPKLEAFMVKRGTPDYLINAVGYAHPDYVGELALEDFRRQMDVNYFGQLIPTLAVLPSMVQAGRGHLAFVSSMMGYFGIIGFAAYAPTKFALVGLAEVLRHELRPAGISVSVLYPPDTNTPGFDTENATKPAETKALSAKVSVAEPTDVALDFLKGITNRDFYILPSGAGMVWRLQRYVPQLVRVFLDRDLRAARRRVGKA